MRVNRSPFKPRAKAGIYKIENKADENEATVYIYDEIGWFGIMAETFVKEMETIKAKTVHIRLNTPGGDVFDGTAIANAIKQHKSKTIIHIDGLAASIGSIIALAGDEIHMAENAFFMFHEAWSFVIGNASNMRDEADLLDKIDGVLAKTYAKKTGKEVNEIKDLMSAETWLTAEEALEMGMIDSIEEDEKDEKAKANLFDLSVFANVPDRLKGEKQKPTARDLERVLRDAGLSSKEAKAVLADGLGDLRDEDDLEPDVVDESQRDVEAKDQRDVEEVDEPEEDQAEELPIKDRTYDLIGRANKLTNFKQGA